jgi:hypothetical protein
LLRWFFDFVARGFDFVAPGFDSVALGLENAFYSAASRMAL